MIADTESVTKSACRDKERSVTGTFEEGVGCNGRAHLDVIERIVRDGCARREIQQVPDALDRCITVLPGILGQQLVTDERAVGTASDNIGKRAATINPDLPHPRYPRDSR